MQLSRHTENTLLYAIAATNTYENPHAQLNMDKKQVITNSAFTTKKIQKCRKKKKIQKNKHDKWKLYNFCIRNIVNVNDAIKFSSGPHLSILKRKIKLEICL